MPMSMQRSRIAATAALLCATTALGGCLDHPVKPVQYDSSSVGGSVLQIEANREVDILFVIDNSGSMAEIQARLAANFQAFIGELDAVEANYRIGVVTTDNGQPRDPTNRFNGGDLQRSSCLDRLDRGDFEFFGFDASYACTDHCMLSDADLQPADGSAPKPWLERLDGSTNLPEGIAVLDAFQCLAPQGIGGSGFEAPLETMYRSLTRSEVAGDLNHGFLRDNAHLAIIVITDENDCSFNPEHVEIFRDNKTFWSDPEAQIATSAVCWNAGARCEGPGPVYDGCDPADYDTSGALTSDPAAAVLYPLSRYTTLLSDLQAQKGPDRRVMVAAITGVPETFGEGTPIPYTDSADPMDQQEFGIGPGCVFTSDDDPEAVGVARPPVRLREFVAAFPIDPQSARPGLYSICQDDFTGPLADIGAQIKANLRPTCIPDCLRDTNPESPILEPECIVTQSITDPATQAVSSEALRPCIAAGDAWEVPSGVDACYAFLVDSVGETATLRDDMSIDPETGDIACAASGNVELKIIRSAPPPSGAAISASCQIETQRSIFCPDLVD